MHRIKQTVIKATSAFMDMITKHLWKREKMLLMVHLLGHHPNLPTSFQQILASRVIQDCLTVNTDAILVLASTGYLDLWVKKMCMLWHDTTNYVEGNVLRMGQEEWEAMSNFAPGAAVKSITLNIPAFFILYYIFMLYTIIVVVCFM